MIFEQYINGKPQRCLATGMAPRSFAQSTITGYLHEQGFCISSDGSVKPFFLNETHTICAPDTGREEVGIILPFENAFPLIDISTIPVADTPLIDFDTCGKKLKKLYRLFSYLEAARKAGAVSEDFFNAALAAPLCLFADDTEQRLIVLPPRLVVRCVTAEPERALAFHYFWAHPDGAAAEPAAAANFLLAALSYAYLTASPPFNCSADPFGSGKQHCRKTPAIGGRCAAESADAEQLVQNMRDGVFVPIALRLPAIEPRFAQLIDDGLSVMQKKKSMEKQAIPVFMQLCTYRDEAAPFFSAAGQEPLPQTGQTATGDRAAGSSVLAVQSFIERKGREVRRRRFFIRYRGGLIAAAAFIFGIIGIAAAITVQLRQPPETAGLSAEQVVQGFYAAIGDLDQAKMSAYTKNKAGAEYDGLLLHLFVTSKMREAYEQKKIYYSPEEFLLLCNAVRTAKKTDSADHIKQAVITMLNGGSVYGISHLSVTAAGQSGVFDVSFYYWVPLFPPEKTEELLNSSEAEAARRNFFPIQVFRYHDRVRLTEIKGSLFIDSLEPLERTVIAESSDDLFAAYFLPPAQQPAYIRETADSGH